MKHSDPAAAGRGRGPGALPATATAHRFADPALLQAALTPPGAAAGTAPDYERLEFLGDRVLALVVADLLFDRFPGEDEGALSLRLVALVRKEALAEVARESGIAGALAPVAGASPSESVLADACEAVIGAHWLDGGHGAAAAFVRRWWQPRMEAEPTPPRDAKTRLQEWAQGRGRPLPEYRILDRSGPDHAPEFLVEARVEDAAPAEGRGATRRAAEMAAASRLLETLEGTGD